MKHVFNGNEKLSFFEELIWDHSYNEDIDMVERGNVNNHFVIICITLAIVGLSYFCYGM